MDTVPKTFRAKLSKSIKSEYCEDIKNNNAYIQEMKKNEFDKTAIKLLVHSNKMNIFIHNGDLYNLFRELKKYKKLSFIAIEEMETKMELGETINLFNFETNNKIENEGAYLKYCNNIKDCINECEAILNIFMEVFMQEYFGMFHIMHNAIMQ